MSIFNTRTVGLILFNLIVFCNCQNNYTFQCPLKKENPNHKDLFVPKFKDVIGFQVSRRATHQLMTRIFAIFLREIIGYQNITIYNLDIYNPDEEEYKKLFQTLDNLNQNHPSKLSLPSIDLEVWLHPDYHALPPYVTEAGLSTDPGRFGWFVPTFEVDETESFRILHYSVFKNPNNTYFNEYLIDDDDIRHIKHVYG